MNTKVKLTREKFLNWYFTDRDDILVTANNMISQLYDTGKYSVDVRELLEGCSELPDYIMENFIDEYNDTIYYVPEEIKLID